MAEIQPEPEVREASGDGIAEQRRALPDEPGVYIFRDRAGKVLYVGKARSIRKRVAGHFSGKTRTRAMTERARAIEFLVTGTEAEALLAEQQFIKRYRPRFNIRLRDDKSYPYIAISMDEEFPRVYFTRERHRSGRLYFGPYSNAKRTRETLELLGKLFQYRTCDGAEPGRRSGVPCLDYYIKRCQAPCVGYIDREEYRRNIDAIAGFLSGRYRDIERELERKMAEAAGNEQFERAAIYRDRLDSVRAMMERRSVAGESLENADVVAVATERGTANAQVFQVRDGILAERQSFYLTNAAEQDEGEVCEEFLAQYYSAAPAVPRLIVVGAAVRDRAPLLAEALGRTRGGPVEVRIAERGDMRKLREMAERNAHLALAQDELRRERRRSDRVDSVAALKDALRLETLPIRIEGYDISNIGGEHTVASMVVFEAGAPKKADYRRFRIRGDRSAGPDDFASMREVLARRASRLVGEADRSPHDAERDPSFASLPDLIVIDGGKGQLSSGIDAIGTLIDRGVAVISLAKRLEEVYVPGRSAPLQIAPDSEASRLLQRIRDEAHRFALDLHRNRRDHSMTRSILDELPGVGPIRKRALLQHFGSPERVAEATSEEIEAVPGIPGKVAREIHGQLHRAG
ncbi:MAG: excinuclease ABC subunit UvrC [Actinomycetota bacterium]|nr:excinuclease ABC subunit UvrC [Actinomycetota bacterium]